jgi:hypothetical protein
MKMLLMSFCVYVIDEIDRDDFWQHQDRGLAIFVADTFYRYYQVPQDFSELVVVTDQFHLKPILPFLTGDGRFYVLTLSQKDVRFMQGDRMSLREVEVLNLPTSMDEALQYDETAGDGQFRIGTTSGASNFTSSQQPGQFHGQGSPDQDDIKQDLLQFFHVIDDAVHEFLKDKRAPLILAGVEYLMPIYHEANTYPHLVTEDNIAGNVKVEKPEELHEKAWAIAEPLFTKAIDDAANYYHDLSNTNVTSTDLNETVPAAYYGRVQQLFVAVGRQQWGRFDAEANEMQIHSEPEPGDEDLLDAAAIQTIVNGGVVYAVEPEKMPDKAAIAAVFRY